MSNWPHQRLGLQCNSFERALDRLLEALDQPPSEWVDDAIVKRFGVAFAQGLKAVHRTLLLRGCELAWDAEEVIHRAGDEVLGSRSTWFSMHSLYRASTEGVTDTTTLSAFIRIEAEPALSRLRGVLVRLERELATTPIASRCVMPGLEEDRIAAIQHVLALTDGVQRLELFGSRAVGQHRPDSDLDLLLDAPGLTASGVARLHRALEGALPGLVVDLVWLQGGVEAGFLARITLHSYPVWPGPLPRPNPSLGIEF